MNSRRTANASSRVEIFSANCKDVMSSTKSEASELAEIRLSSISSSWVLWISMMTLILAPMSLCTRTATLPPCPSVSCAHSASGKWKTGVRMGELARLVRELGGEVLSGVGGDSAPYGLCGAAKGAIDLPLRSTNWNCIPCVTSRKTSGDSSNDAATIP